MMERLTFEGNFCDIAQCDATPGGSYCESGSCTQRKVWERLKQFEDKCESPEVMAKAMDMEEILGDEYYSVDRMLELLKADKAGRLVVLPCKVGDTVWVTRNPWTGKLLKKPLDAYVNGVKMYSHGIYVNLLFDTRKINGTRDYEINHIGKTVFLTREEAEAALEATKK